MRPSHAPADGVVALTGAGSNERIAAGVSLLADGQGQTHAGLRGQSRRHPRGCCARSSEDAVRRLYDCCVDLGFTANDTIGNARETAEWVKRHAAIRSLIVVTADYHMPRAMLELRAVLRPPAFTLQTYAVPTKALKAKGWWRSPGAARLMVVEYCKYLAILGREAVLGLGPRTTPAAQPQSPQSQSPQPKA